MIRKLIKKRRNKKKEEKKEQTTKQTYEGLIKEYYKTQDKKIITELMHAQYDKLIKEEEKNMPRGRELPDIKKKIIKAEAYGRVFLALKDKYGYDDPVVSDLEKYVEEKRSEIRRYWDQHLKLLRLRGKSNKRNK